MDLCLICCSKDIQNLKYKNRLSKNLNVFFLLKNLLQVPNTQLEINLRENGNPENWIRLCNQCSDLTRQAEKLYCKIVKTEIELKKVRKLIIGKVLSTSPPIGLINDDDDNGTQVVVVKSEKGEKFEKRKEIWKTTRSFTTNFDYRKCTNTVNPFIENDELATFSLLNQQDKQDNEIEMKVGPITSEFETDTDFNECVSDWDPEVNDDKTKEKFNHEDKPKRPEKRQKSTKQWSPVKRPKFDGKYKCKFCDKLFEKRGTCTTHEAQKHTSNENQFICDICGKAWNNNKSLVSHRWGVHRLKKDGTSLPALSKRTKPSRPRRTNRIFRKMVNIDGKWKCRYCDKLFNTKDGLYGHEATKHRATPGHFVCDICGKAWSSNNELVKHRWGIHKVRVDGTPVPDKPKIMEEPQTCNLCGKIFSSRKSVKNHIRFVHKNEKRV